MTLGAGEKLPTFAERVFKRAMQHLVTRGQLVDEMLAEAPLADMVRETNRVLAEAVKRGIDTEIPAAMRDKLDRDVFVFSACKTYAQLKEVSLLLMDKDKNRVKPFEQFYREVADRHATYNKQYLEAEYYFARNSAQGAARWAAVEADGDSYPLQYRTAKDDSVRREHAPLEGITLPPSDPFWDSCYPPNGWRCRCLAVQVRKGKYPASASGQAQDLGEKAVSGKNEMFRFNPGKQRVIFPPHHPYLKVKERVGGIIEGLYEKHSEVKRAQRELVSWYKENLPTTTVGKFPAKRFEVKHPDFKQPVVVNATFYNEVIAHYQRDKNYVKKLSVAKEAHQLLPRATYLGEESPRHGSTYSFRVFEASHEGETVVMKCKETTDGLYLYYMRLK